MTAAISFPRHPRRAWRCFSKPRIHGPFRLTDNRANIKRDDPWNICLIEEVSCLIAESLPDLRDHGLIKRSFLEVMPNTNGCAALRLNGNGLVENMIGFNIGVEIGQLMALAVFLVVMLQWRRTASFERLAVAANALILTAGFMLTEYQLAGYFSAGTLT